MDHSPGIVEPTQPPMTGAESFIRAIKTRDLVMTEGAVVERLRRNRAVTLHPRAAHAPLIYTASGRAALEQLWRGYIGVAEESGLPIIVFTPTWRASPERLREASLSDVTTVSRDAVALLREVRAAHAKPESRVFVGALLGCRGDAYRPQEAPGPECSQRFHGPQVEALSRAEPDFLMAATLPAFGEALGLARALAATGRPYALSFIVRPSGVLLDGTPLADAVARIDDAVDPAPLFLLGGCVHPALFEQALEVASLARREVLERVIGLQGNGSRKSPEELDGSDRLDADEPELFAEAMNSLRNRFGARVLGGCCGTDERHIAAVARRTPAPAGTPPGGTAFPCRGT